MRIDSSVTPLIQPQSSAPKVAQSETDFGQLLMDALHEVNAQQQNSTALQNQWMAGQPVELHDLMIAMESASTSMSLTMQVRNKLLEAYQEISHMQI